MFPRHIGVFRRQPSGERKTWRLTAECNLLHNRSTPRRGRCLIRGQILPACRTPNHPTQGLEHENVFLHFGPGRRVFTFFIHRRRRQRREKGGGREETAVASHRGLSRQVDPLGPLCGGRFPQAAAAPRVVSAGPADRRPRPTRLDHPRRMAGRRHAHRRKQRSVRAAHAIRSKFAAGDPSRLSSHSAGVQAVRAEAEGRDALPGGRSGETVADEVRRGAEGGWFFGQGERVDARRQNARAHREPPGRDDLHFAVPGGAGVARGDSFRRRIARPVGRPGPRLCQPGPADGVSSGTRSTRPSRPGRCSMRSAWWPATNTPPRPDGIARMRWP